MEKQESKKAWVTPELIVLVRSKSEEGVLLTCKSGLTSGPLNIFNECWANITFPNCTIGCDTINIS